MSLYIVLDSEPPDRSSYPNTKTITKLKAIKLLTRAYYAVFSSNPSRQETFYLL
jgi:hypothetical protein